MEANNEIAWKLVEVKASELIPNPKNPKTKTKRGIARLNHSLSKFGVVFDGIINADNRIIDGHSRWEKSKPEDILHVFKPSRLLTDEEYIEMNAVFDMAAAGEVNMEIIDDILTDEQMDEWEMDKRVKEAKERSKGAVYPLVPQFNEKYDAIVIICDNDIDTLFIKNALGLGREQSYKNSLVKETSVCTAKQFIEMWNGKA